MGNLVNSMGIDGANAAVDRAIDTAVSTLLGPTSVSMVQNSSCTDMQALQTTSKLAKVEIFRLEDGGRLSILAEFLKVICQRSVRSNGLEGGLPKML